MGNYNFKVKKILWTPKNTIFMQTIYYSFIKYSCIKNFINNSKFQQFLK
jgi:hypothetical protein